MLRTTIGTYSTAIKALVGIHVPEEIGVGGHLPADR